MKKFIIFAVMATLALGVSAEGYQVNSLSAKQNGMGHTGVAQKLGAESMIFNPAGMAFMNRTIDFSGSFTAIFSSASAVYNETKYTTDSDPSTPMAFNLGFNIYKNLKAGVSFYTPYGSGINWGENWPMAVMNQSVKLKAFTVQPTVAWRILPNLSIGAGAMVTWGTVDMNKGLISGESFGMIAGAAGVQWPASATPASINLSGKAAVTVGINVGAMWDISDKVTIGASFRSQMNLKVKKGIASVNYANATVQAMLQDKLGLIDQANFTAAMPAPAVWNLGVAYKPVSKLLLALDLQLTQWDAYKSLDVEFALPVTAFDQHIPKNYKASMLYKLGAQYSLTDRFDLRLGLMVDTTPVQLDNFNPETPGMTRISPSVGFSFRPVKFLSIDAALLYVAGLGRNGASVTTTDMLTQQPVTYTADYSISAWNPSIGVSLHF